MEDELSGIGAVSVTVEGESLPDLPILIDISNNSDVIESDVVAIIVELDQVELEENLSRLKLGKVRLKKDKERFELEKQEFELAKSVLSEENIKLEESQNEFHIFLTSIGIFFP